MRQVYDGGCFVSQLLQMTFGISWRATPLKHFILTQAGRSLYFVHTYNVEYQVNSTPGELNFFGFMCPWAAFMGRNGAHHHRCIQISFTRWLDPNMTLNSKKRMYRLTWSPNDHLFKWVVHLFLNLCLVFNLVSLWVLMILVRATWNTSKYTNTSYENSLIL